MDLPNITDLHEFNRVLIAINDLSDEAGLCDISDVKAYCTSMTYGGGLPNYVKIIHLARHANIISLSKRKLSLSELGIEFLALNPSQYYEVTDPQKAFLAEKVFLKGPWKHKVRGLFQNFYPNHEKVTYEFAFFTGLPIAHAKIIYLLEFLKVISMETNKLYVASNYVYLVRQLLIYRKDLSIEQLDESLSKDRQLSTLAEQSVTDYEKLRLQNLGRMVEADLVLRISQLEVAAGYDIRSFDGTVPSTEYDRFIEVKASNYPKLRFYWSDNEYRIAKNLGKQYWIYFIPEYSPTKPIVPIMIQDPVNVLINHSGISMTPSTYLVQANEQVKFQTIDSSGLPGLQVSDT